MSADDSAALWQEVNRLKDEQGNMRVEAALAAKAMADAATAIDRLTAQVEALRTEVAERRGATRIAWAIVGLLVALGVPAAYLAHVGGQK